VPHDAPARRGRRVSMRRRPCSAETTGSAPLLPEDPHRASADPRPAALARGSPGAGSASVGGGSGCLAFAGWEAPGRQDRSLSQWTKLSSRPTTTPAVEIR
jgi:hypothetical protein